MVDTYIKTSALAEATTIVAADEVVVLQGGVLKRATTELLLGYVITRPWKLIPTGDYTHTPASTSSITMANTHDVTVGTPVKYTFDGSTYYYGIITAATHDTSITIAGISLSGDIAASGLYFGMPERVIQQEFFISGAFATAAADMLLTKGYQAFQWLGPKAYLVKTVATQGTADTGATEPTVSVKVNGSEVSSGGIVLSSTAGTFVANSAVDIQSANYDINPGEAIEIACTSLGTNSNSANLSVGCVFVLE